VRSYSVAVAALALDAPIKWVDNTLSHHSVLGVASASRDVARRVSFSALLSLAITRALQAELGMSTAAALSMAQNISTQSSDTVVQRGLVALHVDVPAVRALLETRLAETMESAPSPRRGRPPGSRT